MRYPVNYSDGMMLTDNAILYEVNDLHQNLGEIVPLVSDEGSQCVFELEGCHAALELKKILEHLETKRDEAALQQVEKLLDHVSEKLKTIGETLPFPFPGLSLPASESGHYVFGLKNTAELSNFSFFILYGLSQNGKSMSFYDASQWLVSEAGRVASIRDKLESERLKTKQAELDQLTEEKVSTAASKEWVVICILFMAFLFMMFLGYQWLFR